MKAEGGRRKVEGFAAVVLVWLIAAPTAAQQTQLKLLENMPADLLRYTGGARPNADGLADHNRDGFRSPEFQARAMHYMIRAIVRRHERCIDEGWRAVDATFREQNDQGSFSSKGAPHGGPSAVAFWLAELGQAVLVLQESELKPKYEKQLDAVKPKILKAARWLAEPKQQKRLEHDDADTPNRLLFDALAYGLSGVLANDDALKQTGRRFVDLAMARYRESDGVFLEKGGHDSSYQAVATLKLQMWTLYFPDKKLDAAIDRAVRWELGRVGADGQVSVVGNTRTGLGQERWQGREKDVNLSEITLCLLYHYARTGDKDSLSAAQRIAERRKP
jgi:hypothetical protein